MLRKICHALGLMNHMGADEIGNEAPIAIKISKLKLIECNREMMFRTGNKALRIRNYYVIIDGSSQIGK